MRQTQKQVKIVTGPWKDQVGFVLDRFNYNGQTLTVIKIRKQKSDGEFFHAFATVQPHDYQPI